MSTATDSTRAGAEGKLLRVSNASISLLRCLVPTLKEVYPEIERASRLGWDESLLFTVGDKKIDITGVAADTDFLPMFGFPLTERRPGDGVERPE